MAWPSYPAETAGTAGRVAGSDWNAAAKLNVSWDAKALSTAGVVAVDGDGKYTVTYSSSNATVNNITGYSEGDVMYFRADVSGSSTSLTALTFAHSTTSTGMRFVAGVSPVLKGDDHWLQVVAMSSVLVTGITMYST